MNYIWGNGRWPEFVWDSQELLQPLASVRFKQGMLMYRLNELGFDEAIKARLDTLVNDARNTSEIEGVKLDPEGIRSSAAQRLGIRFAGLREINDQRIDGLVDLLLDATINFSKPLSSERLKGWQAGLFPTGFSGINRIIVGDWRDGTMQVVSGRYGRETVHYEAPPASRIPHEMDRFINWFNSNQGIDEVLKAGITHLYFVTIHPFSDGNGRIARALTDMQLSRAENSSRRFYSLSAQIKKSRKQYYLILEKMQKGKGDITEWLLWFLACFSRAMEESNSVLDKVVMTDSFWKKHRETLLNQRQKKMINKLLSAGHTGFQGGINNRKYASMTKTSRATAQRDLADLLSKGILVRLPGGGRSTSYEIRY